jgi:hypothetical protein
MHVPIHASPEDLEFEGNTEQIPKQARMLVPEFETHIHFFVHSPTHPTCLAGHPLSFHPFLWHNASTCTCSSLCSKYKTGHCLGVQKVLSGKATWFWDFWYICTMYGHIICDIQICIGSVYLGKDIMTEQDVALKLELTEDSNSNLVHEYSIYWAISGLPGIPKVHWYGREGPYHVIILDHLSSTFKEIGQMSIDTNVLECNQKGALKSQKTKGDCRGANKTMIQM